MGQIHCEHVSHNMVAFQVAIKIASCDMAFRVKSILQGGKDIPHFQRLNFQSLI